ncbi:hypothetical protein [Mycolicibacterium houstonense]|uniref:hypothetical protein n=1 Tax=Mycolicibacterium houstonense TaxID=146021 RepID=UPI003F9DED8D
MTAVIVVWLGVAYVRVQWDEWDVVAEQSPRPWVRRALRRKSTRVPLIIVMEALGLGLAVLFRGGYGCVCDGPVD